MPTVTGDDERIGGIFFSHSHRQIIATLRHHSLTRLYSGIFSVLFSSLSNMTVPPFQLIEIILAYDKYGRTYGKKSPLSISFENNYLNPYSEVFAWHFIEKSSVVLSYLSKQQT